MAQSVIERRVSPFEGEPETCTYYENGEPAYDVLIRELTPEGVKVAEGWAAFACLVLAFVAFVSFLGSPLCIVLPIGILLSNQGMVKWFARGYLVETRVIFTPATFKVFQDGAWQVYDRTLDHNFVMMKHDKARDEEEDHAFRARQDQASGHRPSAPYKRYYSDSFHIVFEYVGQRFDIATVFEEKRARAVAARLKACDQVLNSVSKMGEGKALSPQEQWGDLPGKLPGSL